VIKIEITQLFLTASHDVRSI